MRKNLQPSPLAAIEIILGLSAALRGMYLIIASALGKHLVVGTGVPEFNVFQGVLYILSGVLLIIATLRNSRLFRAVGLSTVGFGSMFVAGKIYADSSWSVTSVMGSVALAIFSFVLLVHLVLEKRQ